MVYGAVHQNSGHVEVYSEPGHGTTFKMYFPRIQGNPETLMAPAQAREVCGTGTIVLVEDNELVRAFAERLLRDHGYEVHAFPNGEDALQAVEQMPGPIDLLVTDVVMPGINGRVLADRLRRLRPDVKVLFTSGYTENVIVHHGVLADDVEFIPEAVHGRDADGACA